MKDSGAQRGESAMAVGSGTTRGTDSLAILSYKGQGQHKSETSVYLLCLVRGDMRCVVGLQRGLILPLCRLADARNRTGTLVAGNLYEAQKDNRSGSSCTLISALQQSVVVTYLYPGPYCCSSLWDKA